MWNVGPCLMQMWYPLTSLLCHFLVSKVTRIWQFADQSRHSATGTHVPYEITLYLPPGRGDIPAFTPAEAGTLFSDPGGMQG